MVRNAIFTEPDDQSAWIYYHHILSIQKLGGGAEASTETGIRLSQRLAKLAVSEDDGAYCETLQQEHDMCAELLEVEEDSKWALTTMAYILQLLALRLEDKEEAAAKRQECVALYERLATLDPMHGGFYRAQIELGERLHAGGAGDTSGSDPA